MRARRALLYMPGDEMTKIRKATTLGVDCICMDMEDGVALNRKTEARQTIATTSPFPGGNPLSAWAFTSACAATNQPVHGTDCA